MRKNKASSLKKKYPSDISSEGSRKKDQKSSSKRKKNSKCAAF